MLSPEVLYAMNEASKAYVDMDKLYIRCREFIAKIAGTEAGLVTTGASDSLLLTVAE